MAFPHFKQLIHLSLLGPEFFHIPKRDVSGCGFFTTTGSQAVFEVGARATGASIFQFVTSRIGGGILPYFNWQLIELLSGLENGHWLFNKLINI